LFQIYTYKTNTLGASLQPADLPEKANAMIEKMKADREFFIDIQAEMNTAYEYGIDGAQQALEKYGINVGAISKVAMYYAEQDGNNIEEMTKWGNLLDKKMKEYTEKYAKDQEAILLMISNSKSNILYKQKDSNRWNPFLVILNCLFFSNNNIYRCTR
jgi:hypothetical protein